MRAKVLVATDCLSEGVNLQDDFQAVVHYDLAWNPTRHEQREGRVDRFGQPRESSGLCCCTARTPASTASSSTSCCASTRRSARTSASACRCRPSRPVLAALLEGVLHARPGTDQLTLDLGLDTAGPELDEQWRTSAEAEKASAPATPRPDPARRGPGRGRRCPGSLGSPDNVAGFVRTVLTETRRQLTPTPDGFTADLSPPPVGLRDALGRPTQPMPFAPTCPPHAVPPCSCGLTRASPHWPATSSTPRWTLPCPHQPGQPGAAASSPPAP